MQLELSASEIPAHLMEYFEPVDVQVPSKNLLGIPHRTALALQADGWVWRSEIIWHAPNKMPESVRDRPTRAHEQILLFGVGPRYYYDQDAVREPLADDTLKKNGIGADGKGYPVNNRSITPDVYGIKEFSGNMKPGASRSMNPAGRNKRTVWTIATTPMPTKLRGGSSAHYAAWPPALVEVMIKASTCNRETDDSRCVILDPFAGTGTTGQVAEQLGRDAILIDLGYQELQAKRTDNLQISMEAFI